MLLISDHAVPCHMHWQNLISPVAGAIDLGAKNGEHAQRRITVAPRPLRFQVHAHWEHKKISHVPYYERPSVHKKRYFFGIGHFGEEICEHLAAVVVILRLRTDNHHHCQDPLLRT